MEKESVDNRLALLEKRVEVIEKNQKEYTETINAVDEKVTSLNNRIGVEFSALADSNKHLRDHLTKQDDQYDKIVNTVLVGNQKAEERADEYKTKQWADVLQLVSTLVTSGGIVYIIIEYLMR